MFHTVQNHMTYKGHTEAQRKKARESQAERRKVAAEQAWLCYVEQDTAGQHNTRVPFTSEARSHRYHNISTQHHNTTCNKNDIIS